MLQQTLVPRCLFLFIVGMDTYFLFRLDLGMGHLGDGCSLVSRPEKACSSRGSVWEAPPVVLLWWVVLRLRLDGRDPCSLVKMTSGPSVVGRVHGIGCLRLTFW